MTLKKRERTAIKNLVLDCDLYGLSELDSLEYIRQRYGKAISRSYYYKVKNSINSDPFVDRWFNHFCKIGYLAAHKKAIEEMELFHNKTKELLFKEFQNERRQIDNIVKLLERVELQSKRLEELYTAGPVLSNVRKIVHDLERKLPLETITQVI